MESTYFPSAVFFLSQKCQLEKELKEETTKLQSDSLSLKKEVKALNDITNQQAKTIVSLQTGNSVACRSTPSSAHRSVKRKSIATDLKAALSVCDPHFVPVSVEVENVESGENDIKNGKFNTAEKKIIKR